MKSGCPAWTESQNREENMRNLNLLGATQDIGWVTHVCTLAHFTPFVHLYLWGAERRDFGSIITGRVAADRKNRPICLSSCAVAADYREQECLFLLLNINNRLFFCSAWYNVCLIEVMKWTIFMHTHAGLDAQLYLSVQSNVVAHLLWKNYNVYIWSLW